MISLDEALKRSDTAVASAGGSLNSLPVAMATVHLVGSVDTGMVKDGLVTWLINSSGRHAVEAVHAYERIGALASARLLAQAIAHAAPSGLPEDDDRRAATIADLPDASVDAIDDLCAQMLEYPDDVGALLELYVASHEAEFLPPKEDS